MIKNNNIINNEASKFSIASDLKGDNMLQNCNKENIANSFDNAMNHIINAIKL